MLLLPCRLAVIARPLTSLPPPPSLDQSHALYKRSMQGLVRDLDVADVKDYLANAVLPTTDVGQIREGPLYATYSGARALDAMGRAVRRMRALFEREHRRQAKEREGAAVSDEAVMARAWDVLGGLEHRRTTRRTTHHARAAAKKTLVRIAAAAGNEAPNYRPRPDGDSPRRHFSQLRRWSRLMSAANNEQELATQLQKVRSLTRKSNARRHMDPPHAVLTEVVNVVENMRRSSAATAATSKSSTRGSVVSRSGRASMLRVVTGADKSERHGSVVSELGMSPEGRRATMATLAESGDEGGD